MAETHTKRCCPSHLPLQGLTTCSGTALGSTIMRVIGSVPVCVCVSVCPRVFLSVSPSVCACFSGYSLCSPFLVSFSVSVSLYPFSLRLCLYWHLSLLLCPPFFLSLGHLFFSVSVLFSLPLSLSRLPSSQTSPLLSAASSSPSSSPFFFFSFFSSFLSSLPLFPPPPFSFRLCLSLSISF